MDRSDVIDELGTVAEGRPVPGQVVDPADRCPDG
jgi:hypothetical protein